MESVKATFGIEDKSTNGSEETVSSPTQESLHILHECRNTLEETVMNCPVYDLPDLDLSTLLTTMVENLHAVSHFKSETFSLLRYAVDFGTYAIVKESLKRATKWSAKYYTDPSSYYPVTECKIRFGDVAFMTPLALPSVDMPKEKQERLREWVEPFRPVRQRTVRSEITKDKVCLYEGTLCILSVSGVKG